MEPVLVVLVVAAGAVLAAVMAVVRWHVGRDMGPADSAETGHPGHARPARGGRLGGDSREASHPDDSDALLVPDDLAELDAAFAEISAESGVSVSVLLAARLQPLIARKVPIRAIRAASGPRSVRVQFADGTVVRARGTRAGDMGVLAQEVLQHSVRLTALSHETGQTHLVFSGPQTRRPIGAIALGLDQPE
ncbi:MAG TPA: hypothetical protein VHM65_06625 [Candidatus Lustribacter sp.]|nr:hypothetical protein [Candidatus Lustribacter sp.]